MYGEQKRLIFLGIIFMKFGNILNMLFIFHILGSCMILKLMGNKKKQHNLNRIILLYQIFILKRMHN